MKSYHFTIVLGPEASPETQKLEDRLFAAGCDDALVCSNGPTVYLQFDREAETAEQAINSAVANILAAGLGVERYVFWQN